MLRKASKTLQDCVQVLSGTLAYPEGRNRILEAPRGLPERFNLNPRAKSASSPKSAYFLGDTLPVGCATSRVCTAGVSPMALTAAARALCLALHTL